MIPEILVERVIAKDSKRYEGEIDGFIKGSEKHTHNKVNTVHQIDTADVEINGFKATSESFCTITSRFEHEGREYDKVTQCRLMSRLEKLSDSLQGSPWRMLTLEPIYLRDSFVPATPQLTGTFPLFKGLDNYPKTFRHGVWLLASIGIASRYDLPNEDDRESVGKIIGQNHAWLYAAS